MKFVNILLSIFLLLAFSWDVSKLLLENLDEISNSISIKDTSSGDDNNEIDEENKLVSYYDAYILLMAKLNKQEITMDYVDFMEPISIDPIVPPPEPV